MGPKTGDPTFSDEWADEAAQDVGALPYAFNTDFIGYDYVR
jgi:hypothetical protein